MVSLPSLKKQRIWFSVCFHSTLNKQWKVLHMLSLLCAKQCMGYSTCCHCSLSNISGCSSSCALKAHLLSTGWISICCHCCFTRQWMWFSTWYNCPFSKSSGWFPSCHCSKLSSVWVFHMFSLLPFQTSVDAVFLMFSRHI